MKKKITALLLCLGALLTLLAGCGGNQTREESGKLKIVTTLFPQYDFARQLCGDRAEVTLLLPPGVESHSYEPSPADIIKIDKADLFIYTGDNMEPWAKRIIDGITNPDVRVVDASQGITLDASEEEDHDGDGHDHAYDPHIWTSPVLAKAMVQNIADALCESDPEGKETYAARAADYEGKLDALDDEFFSIIGEGRRKEIVFAGRFAFHYFAQRYGLSYTAAYDSCSHEAEPSAQTIAGIIDTIRREQIPVVFYEELTDPKVAQSISEETGAKMLLLHSCHNVSKKDFDSGVTYLSLMEQNAANLKEGLS
ncbi:metal ABC transporter substrate-binding protein [Zongyangia hominis]|uniref:Zinc ABC transporter substrate-binding protein n=1 Tax=Zongyangia hominis TaxID=2763677 RepID=A0A926E8U0_9FIRM|nr:metal ABC transporter substrate-binding protein [Zongyangia hominis]MBC8570005.1 zinc ABC transporter substrate-binding protein [Zongyangia hominis]